MVDESTGRPGPARGGDPSRWALRALQHSDVSESQARRWLARGWLRAGELEGAAARDPASGDNALHVCARKGWVELGAELGDACPGLLNRPNHAQRTPLFVARAQGQHAVAGVLIDRGARLVPPFLRGQIDAALATVRPPVGVPPPRPGVTTPGRALSAGARGQGGASTATGAGAGAGATWPAGGPASAGDFSRAAARGGPSPGRLLLQHTNST